MLACLALAWWWLSTHHFTGDSHEQPTAEPAAPAGGTELVTVPDGVTIGLAAVTNLPLQY